MNISTRKEQQSVIVTITGRLDAVTVPGYETCVHGIVDGGETRLVIDLAELEYISSAGLRGLLVTAKQLKAKNGQLRFANVRGPVREVFDISGFGSIFAMDDSLELSLEALEGRQP